MKRIVIFFSRTGTTRRLAGMIAQRLQCDSEEIVPCKEYSGIVGYVRAGYEALFNRTPLINEPKCSLKDYDLVLIGTPVYAARMAGPMRTFLSACQGSVQRVALFATCQGSGCESTFEGIEELIGLKATVRFCIRVVELDSENVMKKIDDFVNRITGVSN